VAVVRVRVGTIISFTANQAVKGISLSCATTL